MEWLFILTELENSVRLRYRLELGIRWAGEKNINRGTQKIGNLSGATEALAWEQRDFVSVLKPGKGPDAGGR